MKINDTIVAQSTPYGESAIGLIRLTGKKSLEIVNKLFPEKDLNKVKSHTIHYGNLEYKKEIIDEVLVSIFKEPKSYTKENLVEISSHGSTLIMKKIISATTDLGARIADKGEFTFRSFLNGNMDLSQAEAVSELISSENEKAHNLAMKQMRGGFSDEIQKLRNKFIKFASLIELELDFSQEDVEFVDREELLKLTHNIKKKTESLLQSFKLGNAIKNGIPVSIVGRPNSGKSTLLNTILNEDRAIVSNIEGTTRDVIEESIIINGYKFRFVDTAGLRKTTNKIEKIGIKKTYQKIHESAFVLYLIDKENFNATKIEEEIEEIQSQLNTKDAMILIANKNDINKNKLILNKLNNYNILDVSAKNGKGINNILDTLINRIEGWRTLNNEIIIINQRHFESLINTLDSINDVEKGIQHNISGELLSIDIKHALNYLGEITGEITNEHLLDSIFKDFCIGK